MCENSTHIREGRKIKKKIFINNKKENYKIHKYYDDKTKEKCEKDYLEAKRVEITEKFFKKGSVYSEKGQV